MTVANKEKLVSDLKVVISDTEELLRATAGAAGEKVTELRERLGVRLRDAKERVLDMEAALSTRPRRLPVLPTISCMRSHGRLWVLLLPWAWHWRIDRSSLSE
jgi:hypothetical protein